MRRDEKAWDGAWAGSVTGLGEDFIPQLHVRQHVKSKAAGQESSLET